MQGSPHKPSPNGPELEVPIRIRVHAENPECNVDARPVRQETEARNTYMENVDFEKHGYTDACEGCRRVMAGSMTLRPHTTECRQRIEEKMGKDVPERYDKTLGRSIEGLLSKMPAKCGPPGVEAKKQEDCKVLQYPTKDVCICPIFQLLASAIPDARASELCVRALVHSVYIV